MEAVEEVKSATKKSSKAPALNETVLKLHPLNTKTFKMTLVGDTPLVCHKWSEKAKTQMLDKQMKKATGAKKAKDPQEEYENSLYKFPGGGYGFPSIGFKNTAVNACSLIDGITKVEARGAFHVIADEDKTDDLLVKIKGTPSMRQDQVKIMMTSDIRFRGQFKKWEAELTIQYNANMISPEQIVNLYMHAGFGVGIGEWRPAKNGSMGKFHVK